MCLANMYIVYNVINIENYFFVCFSDLLKCFLGEREKMKEELRSCKEKIKVTHIYFFL